MKKLWQEFVKFIMTGNVLMLAVAFILGLAIKQVVTSFTIDIIQPIIGAIVGKPDLTNTLKIVKAYDAYRARRGAIEEQEAPSEDVVVLREIRDLRRAQAR